MKYNPSLHKLSNGVSVIFDPMDLETTSVRIRFDTGSRDEKPEQYGITHFCEHMFCKGTPRFPNDKFLRQNGMTGNASTGNRDLNFYGDCLPDKLELLIDFLSDRLSNAAFDPKKIEKERGPILDELNRASDKDDRKFNDFIDKELFGNKNSVFCSKTLGSPETIKSFTRNQLLSFIESRMSASNCTIIISGKINNPEHVLQTLEEKFKFLKPFDVPQNIEMKYTPKYAHLSQPNHKNVSVNILFKRLYPDDKEYALQRFCFFTMREFIRDELQHCLRYKNSLIYSIQNCSIGNHKFGISGVETQISPENIEKCVALIARTCADIYYNNTMTQEDLDLLKTADKLDDADLLDSRSKRESMLLHHYYCDGELYDFYAASKLFESATLQDVIKYTRGMFDEKDMSILTTGADYNCDLMAIWRKNFKPTKNNVPANSASFSRNTES